MMQDRRSLQGLREDLAGSLLLWLKREFLSHKLVSKYRDAVRDKAETPMLPSYCS